MTRVTVVGCGIVGAAIAYELSQVPSLTVTVVEQQQPAQASTGAALGVLMAAISQKTKGRNLQMRLSSIQRYNDWIPKLELITGRRIRFNQEGILRLCLTGEDLAFWQTLTQVRQQQGWPLEIYDRQQLASNYPYLNLDRIIAAVYSPCDRQIHPTELTLALVEAAKQNGVTFLFNTRVIGVAVQEAVVRQCPEVHTTAGSFSTDWLVIAAGLGSTPLTANLQQPLDLRPVLGQAVHLKLAQPLSQVSQPVITGEDTHIVPLGNAEYWVGATVEFSQAELSEIAPDASALEQVMQRTISFCPTLAEATLLHQWSGLRPRPEGRPAPIVEPLAGYANVLLATGHYRNGVLLAPATAAMIRAMIV